MVRSGAGDIGISRGVVLEVYACKLQVVTVANMRMTAIRVQFGTPLRYYKGAYIEFGVFTKKPANFTVV